MADIYIEDLIAPNFDDVLDDVLEHNHVYYVLKGGRGSTKSSFIAFAIILILTTPGNEKMHAVAYRRRQARSAIPCSIRFRARLTCSA